MSQKTNQVKVEDLLNQYDNNTKKSVKKEDQKNVKSNDQWEEEDNYVFSIGKEQQQQQSPPAKTKGKKKQTVNKGWGEFEQEQTTQPQVPEKQEFTEVQDKKVVKTWKKPGETTKPTVNVNVGEEYFPSLGEEPPKNLPKKEEVVVQPESTQNSNGPKRFVNAKKTAGESFAPIEQVQVQDPIQRAPEKTVQEAPKELPKEKPVEADNKFKFAGDGPRKFVGAKVGKKEETKSEADLLREQKEREVEERLQREKEEAAKNAEARKNWKKENGPKPTTETKAPEETKETKPVETTTNGDANRPKFSNQKKATPQQTKEAVPEKQPVVEQKEEPLPAKPQETQFVEVKASTKGWEDGGKLPKAKKKV